MQIIDDMNQILGFFGKHYELSIYSTAFMWGVNAINEVATWVQGLTTIGAFVVVVLTIISLLQKIILNKRKIDDDGDDN